MFITNIIVILISLAVTRTLAGFTLNETETTRLTTETEGIIKKLYPMADPENNIDWEYNALAKAIALEIVGQDGQLKYKYSSKMGNHYVGFISSENCLKDEQQTAFFELIKKHLIENAGNELLGFAVVAGLGVCTSGGIQENLNRFLFYFISGTQNTNNLQNNYQCYMQLLSLQGNTKLNRLPISAGATVLASSIGRHLNAPEVFSMPNATGFSFGWKELPTGNISRLTDKDWRELFHVTPTEFGKQVYGFEILEKYIVACVDTRKNRKNGGTIEIFNLPVTDINTEKKLLAKTTAPPGCKPQESKATTNGDKRKDMPGTNKGKGDDENGEVREREQETEEREELEGEEREGEEREGEEREGEEREGEEREGEEREGKDREGKDREGKDREGEEREDEKREGEKREGEKRDGEKRDGEKRDGEKREGEKRDGEKREGEDREGEDREGEDREGEEREGEKQDGEKREGEDREGEKREGEKQEGEKQEGEKQEGGKREGGEREGEKREGEKQEGEKREGVKREGEKQEGEKREGEKREGEGEKQEGEKREGEKREGEEREGVKREGEKQEGEKREGEKREGEEREGKKREGEEEDSHRCQQQVDPPEGHEKKNLTPANTKRPPQKVEKLKIAVVPQECITGFPGDTLFEPKNHANGIKYIESVQSVLKTEFRISETAIKNPQWMFNNANFYAECITNQVSNNSALATVSEPYYVRHEGKECTFVGTSVRVPSKIPVTFKTDITKQLRSLDFGGNCETAVVNTAEVVGRVIVTVILVIKPKSFLVTPMGNIKKKQDDVRLSFESTMKG